jgi:hypothetical protein
MTPPSPILHETEFYGTMPSELPETLPAGTRGRAGGMYTSSTELRLRGGEWYWGRWTEEPFDTRIAAKNIDWPTVRKSQSPPLHETGCCEACGGPAPSQLRAWSWPEYFGDRSPVVCATCFGTSGDVNDRERLTATAKRIHERRKSQSPPGQQFKRLGAWVEWTDEGKNRRVGDVVQLGHGQQSVRDLLGQCFWVRDEELRPFSPQPGELCEGIGHRNSDRRGDVVRGTFVRECTSSLFDGACIVDDKSGCSPAVMLDSLRPATPAPPEVRAPERAEFTDAEVAGVARNAAERLIAQMSKPPDPYGIKRESEYCFLPATDKAVEPMRRADPGVVVAKPFNIEPKADGTLPAVALAINALIHREAHADMALAELSERRQRAARRSAQKAAWHSDSARESPRSWKTKMGEIVSWTGPVRK